MENDNHLNIQPCDDMSKKSKYLLCSMPVVQMVTTTELCSVISEL